MLKKLSAIILIALLLTSLFSATALAAGTDFSKLLNTANASIEAAIDKAVIDADNLLNDLNKKIDCTNQLAKQGIISKWEASSRIKNYQADFDNQLDALAKRLISVTDGIVANLLQQAQCMHIKVSVTYVTVNLAGHIYLVDPLRIIGN